MLLQKTLSKDYHRITDITQKDKAGGEVGINAMILRNYNDGRHGGWNNYSCYGQAANRGDFVKKHPMDDTKAKQFKERLAQ